MLKETKGCAAEPRNPVAPVNNTPIQAFAPLYEAQLEFYRKGRAGCAFAAVAARNPRKYGWRFVPVSAESFAIDAALQEAIRDSATSTLSMCFPSVKTESDFRAFLSALFGCNNLIIGQDVISSNARCLGFRAPVSDVVSWVTGFADFAFMPISRRAPCVELSVRVKPRPRYKEILKEAPKGTIHLADMDMKGMSSGLFKWLWKKSFEKTRALLGHEPDLRSAAKTTFAIPTDFLQ